MYSPSDKNLSQIAQINTKLSSDLDGLCDHVYNKGHWGGCINEFYLIVNTHDKELPADPDRLNDKTIAEIKSKYNKDFVVKVMAAKSISSYLIDCDENLLEKLKVALSSSSIVLTSGFSIVKNIIIVIKAFWNVNKNIVGLIS